MRVRRGRTRTSGTKERSKLAVEQNDLICMTRTTNSSDKRAKIMKPSTVAHGEDEKGRATARGTPPTSAGRLPALPFLRHHTRCPAPALLAPTPFSQPIASAFLQPFHIPTLILIYRSVPMSRSYADHKLYDRPWKKANTSLKSCACHSTGGGLGAEATLT
eukprot:4740811-Pleurochrysis_carterae.AAC.3